MFNSGIYFLINKDTLRYYVGSSNNVNRRLGEHLRCLRGNKHCNQHLQNSFNKNGEDSFIVKTFVTERFRELEQAILNNEEYKYNILKLVDEPPDNGGVNNPMYGKKHKKSTREKMSSIAKGRTYSHKVNKSKGRKGLKNPSANKTIYKFNSFEGEIFIGTMWEFYTGRGLSRKGVSKLVHGKLKTYYGWSLLHG